MNQKTGITGYKNLSPRKNYGMNQTFWKKSPFLNDLKKSHHSKLTWFWFGSNSVQVRFRFGSGSVLVRFLFGSCSVLVRFGSGSVLKNYDFKKVHFPDFFKNVISDHF